MKKLILTCLMSCASAFAIYAGPSILDIKHSITDDNIIAPESFETNTRQLEESFYLNSFSASPGEMGPVKLGTPQEYEERLSQLPVEIEMPYNNIVGRYIEMYIDRRRGLVSDMLALHNYYGVIFVEELSKAGLPLELQYLPVIESAINPNAVSRAGATGLWQFMYGTAKGLGMEINSLVDQRRDPRASSANAARYLKELYNIYGDWSLAIAAYNCGPGNVNKAIKRAGGGKKDFWEIYEYLPSETRGYIPAFIAANYVMNYYNKHNIAPRVVKKQLVTDTIMVNDKIHFAQIAHVLNIPVEEIRMLNPQFVKDIIPGNNHPYPLVLPSQQCLSFVISEQDIINYERDKWITNRPYVEPGTSAVVDLGTQPDMIQSENAPENMEPIQAFVSEPKTLIHKVTRGENIRDIAERYGVSVADIQRANNLRTAKIKEGDELNIIIYERPQELVAVAVTNPVAETSVPTTTKPVQQSSTTSQTLKSQAAESSQSNQASVPAKVVNTPVASENPALDFTSTQPSVQTETASANETAATQIPSRRQDRLNNNDNKAKENKQNKKKEPKKPAQPKTVTVKNGDSLDKIAKANGTTVEALQKANNMSAKQTIIQPGQKLKLPASNSGKSGKGKKGRKK